MKIPKNQNAGGAFTPHPPTDEPVRAVVVDITPAENVPTQYGPRDVFKIVFECETEKSPGERYCVWSRRFGVSIAEKSALRPFLKQMFGEDICETRLDANGDLDLEQIVMGHPVKLMIAHTVRDGETYADIISIFADKSANPLKPSGKFVRKKDRDNTGNSGNSQQQRPAQPQAPAQTAAWMQVPVHVGNNAGKKLGDLSKEDLAKLVDKWLPVHQANEFATAADNLLASGLIEAVNAGALPPF